MHRSFENDINRLKDTLLMMSAMVERNLNQSMRMLQERDDSLFDLVTSEEKQVDALDTDVNEQALLFLARQAPVAGDLRFILTAVKISSDLERIGDQAVKIAKRARELNKEPLLKPLIDIPRMSQISLEMLRQSMDAFIHHKPDSVQIIMDRDEEVDGINKQLYRELTSYMVENPQTISRSLHLMGISRHIERVADHSKNIAKKVFFLVEGKDITHKS